MRVCQGNDEGVQTNNVVTCLFFGRGLKFIFENFANVKTQCEAFRPLCSDLLSNSQASGEDISIT